MSAVAVTVHGSEHPWPLAVVVRGVDSDKRVLRALGSIDAAWPEHYYWALRAHERGDFHVTPTGAVWFFEGEEGEALAGL